MTEHSLQTRVAGAWLAVASLLLVITFAFHGAPEAHIGDQMVEIAGRSTVWMTVHWIAAAALSLFVVASLIVLAAGSRLTANGWTASAWAVLPVGALWTLGTAVAEATAVSTAARTGNEAIFAAWWTFSEGLANGFAGVAVCVTVIAANEARSEDRATPVWAAGVAIFAGIASFSGWALWSWADLGFAAPIWVGASALMCLWLLWFGIGLARAGTSHATSRSNAPSHA